jgi:hypothetical protein
MSINLERFAVGRTQVKYAGSEKHSPYKGIRATLKLGTGNSSTTK